MKTIYKYPLDVTDSQQINIPGPFKVLMLAVQNGVPCIWVELQDTVPERIYSFYTYGTGHNFPSYAGDHIGSYMLNEFVWHVYLDEYSQPVLR